MATFLKICQDVRLLSGAQGNGPLTVTNNTGYEQALVKFVVDAYVDIQNTREDFRFLRNKIEFQTIIGQQEYPSLATDIKSFVDGTLYVTRSDSRVTKIRKINYDRAEELYLNNDVGGFPQYYAITPHNDLKIYSSPDAIYQATIDYQADPEILTTDIQIPKLPLAMHNLIIYKALQKFGVFMGTPEIYREYSQEAARLHQKLMSLQIPQKRARAPRFTV